MKALFNIIAKPTGITLYIMMLACCVVYAQRPEIRSVDKTSSSMSEKVTIMGSNFGTDATKLAVYFGAVKGTILTVSNQMIEVEVPAGTTYESISVTNLVSGLTGYSTTSFLLSFSGKHPFDAAKLGTQTDFDAANKLYEHCLCDLDNDGKPDIATANNGTPTVPSNSIAILRNTSTIGTISFTKTLYGIGSPSLSIRCGDLNGDGKKDLVVVDGYSTSGRIFILQNNSTGPGNINFTTSTITLTDRKNSLVEIADFDLNGKPELLITDQGSNVISILTNQSTASVINFAVSPIIITITDAEKVASTDGIIVEDLNGDYFPEIVTSQYQTNTSNLFIVENKSTPGTIAVGTTTKLNIGNTVKRIRVGDLDSDGKKDIAVTQLLGPSVSIFPNQGSNSINFGSPIIIPTEAGPWGLDFGDIDGDGKIDIAVAAIGETKLSLLNNESTPGNIAFTKQTVNTSHITRSIIIADLDGDGKPDLSFTSVDVGSIVFSKVSTIRNGSCMLPSIAPKQTPLTLCTGALPYKLYATVSKGSYYEWRKNGAVVSCGLNQNTFDVTAASGTGVYTVRVIAEGGTCASATGCVEESDGIDITIVAGTAGATTPANNGPVCLGGTLNLSINNIAGVTYEWTGPQGYTGTGTAPTPVTNFSLDKAGLYHVDVKVGSCLLRKQSTLVQAVDIPTFSISPANELVLCQGAPSQNLEVVPNDPAYTYQWFKDGVAVGTGAQLAITSVPSSSGNYIVKAGNTGCSVNIETAPVKVTITTTITANFSAPATACANQKVKFTNGSTSDASVTTFYNWNFDDGKTSTEKDPEHIFTSANTYDVTLTVSYAGNSCAETKTIPITITAAPAVSITNPSNDYTFCEGATLLLQVNGTFTGYAWSTGATTSSIEVSEEGTYSVDVTATNGCVLTASRIVETLPAPSVIVTATPPQINEGESSQLTASGLENYSWEPAETLSQSSIANPVATPLATTAYKVTGLDANGCEGTATIEVKVAGDAIVTKLKPGNFISPNNDGPNELWVVENIMTYPQCGITIYDEKGVKVFEAKPYQNNWDGTFNGKKLPDGVYYYIIRCDGEESAPRAGSITLIR
jgi:gliding motility-associated-like protein